MTRHGTNGRRLGFRAPTSARARVYDDAGRSVEVLLKDLSAHGARLAAAAEASIPRKFLMRFGEYEARGEVVWRKGGEIGVRFIVPGEEEGRVRPRVAAPVKKTPIEDLRGAVKRRGSCRCWLDRYWR